VFDHVFDQGQAPNSSHKNQPDQGNFNLKLISKQGSFKMVLKAKKKKLIFSVILTSCSTWWLNQPSQHS